MVVFIKLLVLFIGCLGGFLFGIISKTVGDVHYSGYAENEIDILRKNNRMINFAFYLEIPLTFLCTPFIALAAGIFAILLMCFAPALIGVIFTRMAVICSILYFLGISVFFFIGMGYCSKMYDKFVINRTEE